ncbi:hypothetical protein DPEC_G00254620 [Dallia pectoralis]|uniref:Uncharacterized protein n=1 Tax=Dallia pectoralis TaxID=75939 RepID=A0ACC2FU12_DALPE|nr:hypothetical protein DPEC_G00254620 [Dallia pectoralis]
MSPSTHLFLSVMLRGQQGRHGGAHETGFHDLLRPGVVAEKSAPLGSSGQSQLTTRERWSCPLPCQLLPLTPPPCATSAYPTNQSHPSTWTDGADVHRRGEEGDGRGDGQKPRTPPSPWPRGW